jgi:hypothetical protein
MKEYVIDLREFDGKIRELISTGLQEHAFTLGWKGWTVGIPGEVRYTDSDVLYFDNDGIIKHSFLVDDDFDNTPITPADFLALTPEDVQAKPEKLRFKPTQSILGRDDSSRAWTLDIFSHVDGDSDDAYIYVCVGTCWAEIIPFEGNEHLCGKVGEP